MRKLIIPLMLAMGASMAQAGGLSDYSTRFYGWNAAHIQRLAVEQMTAKGAPDQADYVAANAFYGENADDYTTYRMELAVAGISVEAAEKQRLEKKWNEWVAARNESSSWGQQGRLLLSYTGEVKRCAGQPGADCVPLNPRTRDLMLARGVNPDKLPVDAAGADALAQSVKTARVQWLRQNLPPVGPLLLSAAPAAPSKTKAK